MQFKAFLTHTIGERVYTFFCDQLSPTNEAKEALSVFHNCMIQIEEAAKVAKEAKEAEENAEKPKEDA